MENISNENPGNKWLSVPLIATVTLYRLQYVVDCYSSYYNECRPHQGIGNKIPVEYHSAGQQGVSSSSNPSVRSIVRKDSLGGLLKSYSRRVA